MAITASTSTALDVPSLVSQLMTVERKPINDLNTKVTSYQSKISSFGTLSGLVSTLQSSLTTLTSSLQGYSAAASDTTAFSAAAGSTAVGGTYSVSIAHLAQAQTLVATGQSSQTAALTTSTSTLAFTINNTTKTVDIPANASLQDISAAINSANLGVSASIVNDGSGSPYRLSISASNTGLKNAITSITVNSGGDNGLNSLLAFNPTTNPPATTTMAQVVDPLDASLNVNGIPITSATNTVTDAIQGVTLTLKNKTSTNATLSVARDNGAINTAVSGFIDAYNALATQLRSRSAYGNTTTATPVLAGDGTVRSMIEQLRNIMMSPATGNLTTLSQIGITSKTDGTLQLSDSTKLSSALASNFSDVSDLFNSSTGFATRLSTWATSMTQTGGVIDQRKQVLTNAVKGYNDQITKLEARMTVLQTQYTTTYSNLNVLLSNMNATSTYLTQQFTKSFLRMKTAFGINAYHQVSLETSVQDADPHKLIAMLFEGALVAISKARTAIAANEMALKGKSISHAISIIGEGLNASLDKNVGGELAQNLSALYDYMVHRLVFANLNNDTAVLDEVSGLLTEIQGAWNSIRDEVVQSTASTPANPQTYARG